MLTWTFSSRSIQVQSCYSSTFLWISFYFYHWYVRYAKERASKYFIYRKKRILIKFQCDIFPIPVRIIFEILANAVFRNFINSWSPKAYKFSTLELLSDVMNPYSNYRLPESTNSISPFKIRHLTKSLFRQKCLSNNGFGLEANHMVRMLWSISCDSPYHMNYMIWSISYASYDMGQYLSFTIYSI